MLFLFAILVFGLASIYTGLSLLARITPALFPGQTLSSVPIIKQIPNQIVNTKPSDQSVFNRRINLLIIGIDRRPQFRLEDAYLNDSVMVATLDPASKSASVLSFPRDLYVYSGGQRDKFAHSYGKGWQEGQSFDSAAGRVASDLKESFGIDTDYYVIMDFKGVEALVDALGGIEVDIPDDLSVGNWYYSDDDVHAQWLSFPSGINELDGYHAVAFGRHREYDSDLKRVKRQQLVMTAALAKVFSLNLLDDPKGVYDAYKDTVETNIPLTKMVSYAPLLKQTQGRMNTYSLGDEVNGKQTLFSMESPWAGFVFDWDPENVQYILNQVFTKSTYVGANVEIQNGYGQEGDARAAALGRYLAYSKGLPTVYIGPEANARPDTTITLYGSDRRELALDIAKWMNLPDTAIVVQDRPSGSTLPDVVITIGRDFKLPG
ncbi:MAG TPA: LCP family protein [Tepidiformaceae bacterium]|nr:LCP family protein [Tepidiformaceae bacterium]